MGYYDTIAYQWHNYTGYQGGSFKKYVLNDFLRSHMESIQDKAILEVGAGNGYFMAWVLERFSGQTPERLVISGISNQLLSIAETHFYLPLAQYLQLDIRSHFPFPAGEFDLVVGTMVFNELPNAGARRGLAEIHRVLSSDGVLLLSVTHPDFIHSLDRRGALKRDHQGLWTMPGSQSMRLPIVRRSRQKYQGLLTEAGFEYQSFDIVANERVFKEKPGLNVGRSTPLGLVFRCWRPMRDSAESGQLA
jgi:SAM-dependent methyltransferase